MEIIFRGYEAMFRCQQCKSERDLLFVRYSPTSNQSIECRSILCSSCYQQKFSSQQFMVHFLSRQDFGDEKESNLFLNPDR